MFIRAIKRWQIDWGLGVALLLATLAAWPFLTRPSLPTSTDAEMHAYRVFEVLTAWRGGVLYPRWAPDFFYAYGYPVFNYYAPLTYYLGAAYGWFFGGAVAGVKFVLVAAAYLGALGMYLFGRDRWGSLAGVVSAAAYSFSPYLLYIDPHARGDAPETFGIALAPLMLWAFGRLRRAPAPGQAVLAALCLAGVLTAHNFMAVLFFGLLVAWLAWEVALGPRLFGWLDPETTASAGPPRRSTLVWLGAALLLGLGLTACMWLPAFWERGAIQYNNVAGGPGTYFDFRRFFIDPRDLFAPALTFDLGATQMRFRYSLGVAQWLLGLLGLLTLFTRRSDRRAVIFWGLVSLGLIYLMLPSSLKLWEAVPPMRFLQFPYRFLGPLAVALGVLAGAALRWADYAPKAPPHGRGLFSTAALAGCLLTAMPLMYPAPWADFGPVTAQRIFQNELMGHGVGTTSANDFLPVTVNIVPRPNQALIDSYQTGMVDKIDRAALPAGAQATVLEHGPAHDRFAITTPTAFTLRIFTFYFPGWQVYLDGQKTDFTLSEYEGWPQVKIPPGEHTVLVRLEDTLPRRVSWGLTLISALGLLALTVWRRSRLTRPAAERLPCRPALALSGVVLLGLALRQAGEAQGWWRVHSTGTQALVAQFQQVTRLENNIVLLGYDLPQLSARPGEKVAVTLYWKALDRIPVSLRVFVHFIGPDGQLWGQSDKWHPADFPTVSWPLDRYVQDQHLALLQVDAPPGQYTVRAGLWFADTGARMRVLDEQGQPTAVDGIVLTTTFQVRPWGQ